MRQLFLVFAYKILLCYWFCFRINTKGVYVAVWHQGNILLIKNSYKKYFTFPSGGIHSGESYRDAACRELREEVGISCAAKDISFSGTFTSNHEYKHDKSWFFELHLNSCPILQCDQYEVISAEFYSVEEASKCFLSPLVADYLSSSKNLPKNKKDLIER